MGSAGSRRSAEVFAEDRLPRPGRLMLGVGSGPPPAGTVRVGVGTGTAPVGSGPGPAGMVGAGTGGSFGPPCLDPGPCPESWQFEPRIWSISWSTAPHWPSRASTPAGPSDATKMLAHRLGTPLE